MIKRYEFFCVFLTGGIVYTIVEIAWRGYSHWSMTIVGGICFLLIHLLNGLLTKKKTAVEFLLKCVLGGAVITLIELAAGVLLNIRLGLDVWDYSDVYGNLWGQTCPSYTLAWIAVSAPAIWLSDIIKKFFGLIGTGDGYVAAERKSGET